MSLNYILFHLNCYFFLIIIYLFVCFDTFILVVVSFCLFLQGFSIEMFAFLQWNLSEKKKWTLSKLKWIIYWSENRWIFLHRKKNFLILKFFKRMNYVKRFGWSVVFSLCGSSEKEKYFLLYVQLFRSRNQVKIYRNGKKTHILFWIWDTQIAFNENKLTKNAKNFFI